MRQEVEAAGFRLVGTGDIVEVDKWSNRGKYGFKIKVDIKKQKSLTDRRIRGPGKVKPAEKVPAAPMVEIPEAPAIAPLTATIITPQDIAAFREMLKGSVSMDMA